MPPSCAARTRTHGSAPIDVVAGGGAPRRAVRGHRGRGRGEHEPDPGDLRHGRGRGKGREVVRALRRSRPLRRRGGRRRRRRGPVHRLRGARPDRRRLRGAARRQRPRGGDGARRAARRAGLGRQHHGEPRHRPRRPGRGVRGGRRDDQRARAVSPDHGHGDRAARLRRLLRRLRARRSPSGTRRRTRTRCATTSPGRSACRRPRSGSSSRTSAAGFGLKIPTFQEEPLVAYLSRKLGRPVKWIEERSENFQTGGHARDTRFHYEAAYKNDGTVTGHPPEVIADVGAPSALCGWGMSFVTWYCLPCVYKIPNSETHLRSVVTNKCPWNAYRGYGKDAASFLMDRIMDHIARETGRDRAEIRFKNFIPPEEFPFPQVSGRDDRQRQLRGGPAHRARHGRLRGLRTPPGGGAERGPLHRPRHRAGADPRGLLDARLAAPQRHRRDRGAGQPDGRGHGAHRRHLSRAAATRPASPRSWPTRSAASSTGSG